MSTPETTATPGRPQGDYIRVAYSDGTEDRAERLQRPGLLIRVERAYPGFDISTGINKAEELIYLAYTALRMDREGAQAPGDDFMAWADSVEDVELIQGPTKPAQPAAQLTSLGSP